MGLERTYNSADVAESANVRNTELVAQRLVEDAYSSSGGAKAPHAERQRFSAWYRKPKPPYEMPPSPEALEALRTRQQMEQQEREMLERIRRSLRDGNFGNAEARDALKQMFRHAGDSGLLRLEDEFNSWLTTAHSQFRLDVGPDPNHRDGVHRMMIFDQYGRVRDFMDYK